jgi:hypothetical protein
MYATRSNRGSRNFRSNRNPWGSTLESDTPDPAPFHELPKDSREDKTPSQTESIRMTAPSLKNETPASQTLSPNYNTNTNYNMNTNTAMTPNPSSLLHPGGSHNSDRTLLPIPTHFQTPATSAPLAQLASPNPPILSPFTPMTPINPSTSVQSRPGAPHLTPQHEAEFKAFKESSNQVIPSLIPQMIFDQTGPPESLPETSTPSLPNAITPNRGHFEPQPTTIIHVDTDGSIKHQVLRPTNKLFNRFQSLSRPLMSPVPSRSTGSYDYAAARPDPSGSSRSHQLKSPRPEPGPEPKSNPSSGFEPVSGTSLEPKPETEPPKSSEPPASPKPPSSPKHPVPLEPNPSIQTEVQLSHDPPKDSSEPGASARETKLERSQLTTIVPPTIGESDKPEPKVDGPVESSNLPPMSSPTISDTLIKPSVRSSPEMNRKVNPSDSAAPATSAPLSLSAPLAVPAPPSDRIKLDPEELTQAIHDEVNRIIENASQSPWIAGLDVASRIFRALAGRPYEPPISDIIRVIVPETSSNSVTTPSLPPSNLTSDSTTASSRPSDLPEIPGPLPIPKPISIPQAQEAVVSGSWTPFFNHDRYITRESMAELSDKSELKLIVELAGRLSSEPIIYLFGYDKIPAVFAKQPLTLTFTNDLLSGTALGQLDRDGDYYVIRLTQFHVQGSPIDFIDIDLPLVVTFSGQLIRTIGI